MATREEEAIHTLVKALHDSPGRIVLVTAGAGTRALAWLLGVAGASRTLLEALTPYDESSFNDFLGRKPAKYVAARTAGLLAGRAVTRGRYLYKGHEPVIGLACTATIVTDRPKRGQHRAHIAAWTADSVCRYALHLNKGQRDRRGEEEMVSLVIMNALSRAYGFDMEMPLPLIPGDRFGKSCVDVSAEIRRVVEGRQDFFGIHPDGRSFTKQRPPRAILSGAFNPLHDGHTGLAAAAGNILGCDVAFELAISNAGKPSLSISQAKERLLQFAGSQAILASGAALFSDKARLYPGVTFVVGIDTAQRVLQPRYYNNNPSEMYAALALIADRECSFLVAGRADEQGNFQAGSELAVPDPYRHLFNVIPAERFRIDQSSSAIRSQDAAARGE